MWKLISQHSCFALVFTLKVIVVYFTHFNFDVTIVANYIQNNRYMCLLFRDIAHINYHAVVLNISLLMNLNYPYQNTK